MTFDSRTRRPRTSRHAASLLAGALLTGAGAAHAQTTYSTNIVNPYYTNVDTFTTTTDINSSTFNRPAIIRPGITNAPTSTSGLGTAVGYATSSYTPQTAGTYRVTSTENYGIGTDGNTNFVQVLYSTAFVPSQPTTNAVLAYSQAVSGDSYSTSLSALTPYTFVNAGYYNDTAANNASSTNRSIGTTTTKIDLYNSGSTQNIADPDTTANGTTGSYTSGTSQTLTISDLGTVSALNSITIAGLSHDYLGDLTATLTHGGVTVDLFDHVGGTTQDASEQNLNDPGSGVIMSGSNTYTFALNGASLSAFGYHDSGNGSGYWDTAPSGTYAASGNAAGGFDAANAGHTLSDFAGTSLNGDWTLSLYDNAPANEGSFLGFKLNISAAPEPSQWASLLVGAVGLGGLALRARRRSAKNSA